MKSRKGFTLVELLAVIMILAIVMLIGLIAVVPTITRAKKDILATEGIALIKSAKAAHENELTPTSNLRLTETDSYCFTLDWLTKFNYYTKKDKNEKYKGSVLVRYDKNTNLYVYSFWLTNGEYFIENGTANDYVIQDGDGGDEILTCGNAKLYYDLPEPINIPSDVIDSLIEEIRNSSHKVSPLLQQIMMMTYYYKNPSSMDASTRDEMMSMNEYFGNDDLSSVPYKTEFKNNSIVLSIKIKNNFVKYMSIPTYKLGDLYIIPLDENSMQIQAILNAFESKDSLVLLDLTDLHFFGNEVEPTPFTPILSNQNDLNEIMSIMNTYFSTVKFFKLSGGYFQINRNMPSVSNDLDTRFNNIIKKYVDEDDMDNVMPLSEQMDMVSYYMLGSDYITTQLFVINSKHEDNYALIEYGDVMNHYTIDMHGDLIYFYYSDIRDYLDTDGSFKFKISLDN